MNSVKCNYLICVLAGLIEYNSLSAHNNNASLLAAAAAASSFPFIGGPAGGPWSHHPHAHHHHAHFAHHSKPPGLLGLQGRSLNEMCQSLIVVYIIILVAVSESVEVGSLDL